MVRSPNRVDYLFGLARNACLAAMIESELAAANMAAEASGKPARRFKEFLWTTLDSWSRERRLIAKADWTQGEANPRFIVTSLSRAEELEAAAMVLRKNHTADQNFIVDILGNAPSLLNLGSRADGLLANSE